jgi:hypothetical protein
MGMKKIKLYTLSEPSTSSYSDVRAEFDAGNFMLRFDFDREGAPFHGGLHFVNLRAVRYHGESHCLLWHIEDAYDTLVEIVDSEWTAEMRKAQPESKYNWDMDHFMIYLDSAGCYEVAASSWRALIEQKGPLLPLKP